tara:strand:- start:5409 stop:5591 length:183 start_codon:yes stop_codon:yes gene_type:complete
MIEVSDLHKQRVRFAWLPVKRWIMHNGFAEPSGHYWLRHVVEVEAGVLREWTAYAMDNDA